MSRSGTEAPRWLAFECSVHDRRDLEGNARRFVLSMGTEASRTSRADFTSFSPWNSLSPERASQSTMPTPEEIALEGSERTSNDLGGEVRRLALHHVGSSHPLAVHRACEAEVRELHDARLVEQDVAGCHVAMEHARQGAPGRRGARARRPSARSTSRPMAATSSHGVRSFARACARTQSPRWMPFDELAHEIRLALFVVP
jgi:hypothetical protein